MAMRAMMTRVYRGLISYALKFGVVGLFGYTIDVGIFNVLRFEHVGAGTWASTPVGAKVVSVTVATIVTWFGNRYWTFKDRRRANFMLELLEFSAIAALGMGIAVGCLYISHYALGYTSPLADNISANVVGLGIATAFRFLMYRFWVYGNYRSDSVHRRQMEAASLADASAVPPRLKTDAD
jgi:putative flippase GtrA